MRVLLCLTLGLLAGCRSSAAPDSPEAAWRAFVAKLQRGDAKGAYTLLTAGTRAAAEQRSKAISDASQGQVRDEPHWLLFASARPASQGELQVVEQSATRARLLSGTQPVTLLKEDGRWLVDLTPHLAGEDARD